MRSCEVFVPLRTAGLNGGRSLFTRLLARAARKGMRRTQTVFDRVLAAAQRATAFVRDG